MKKQWNVQTPEEEPFLEPEGEELVPAETSGSVVIKKRRWIQARKLITADDWWSVWIGFSFFGLSLAVAALRFSYPHTAVTVLPILWDVKDPSTMFTVANGPAMVALVHPLLDSVLTVQVVLSFFFAILQFYFVQKGKPVEKQVPLKFYAPGFFLLELLSVAILILSTEKVLDRYGLKEEIWAFVIGIILGNLLSFVSGLFFFSVSKVATGSSCRLMCPTLLKTFD